MERRRRHAFVKSQAVLGAVLALSLWLSACGTTGALSIDLSVTLYTDERWSAEAEIVFAAQQMQLMGGQIEQSLADSISRWKAQGIQASNSRRVVANGNVSFLIRASGQGLALLNAALFDNQATLQYDSASEPPKIAFRYVPFGSFFSAALSRKFSLTGGKILSSNGLMSSDNTVTWVNPVNAMEATLTPVPWVNWPVILLASGAGLLGVGAIVVGVRRAGKVICPYCGARIPRVAEFCPECGVAR